MVHEHSDKAMSYDEDTRHRAFNYEICNAVDLLSTGIILERMQKLGLSVQETIAIDNLVRAANIMFRQANDRLHKHTLCG